jgi:hypothetical protein
MTIAADPGDTTGNTVWATLNNRDIWGGSHRLVRSSNGGATWVAADGGLNTGNGVVPGGLLVDGSSGSVGSRTLYVTWGGNAYKSVNNGNWTLMFNCLNAAGGRGCHTIAKSGATILLGGEAGMFRSTDSGANFAAVNAPSANAFQGNRGNQFVSYDWSGVSAIRFSAQTPSIVYAAVKGPQNGAGGDATIRGGLYRSADGGVSWTRTYANDFVRGVAVNGAKVYVGSSSAIYAGGYSAGTAGLVASLDGINGFTQKNNGLQWNMASFMTTAGSNLYLVSPGAGIFKTPLF